MEKQRERNIDVQEKHLPAASCTPPTGDLAHNPGMCPDWELNRRPLALWDNTQPTEPHQSRLRCFSIVPPTLQITPTNSILLAAILHES